MSLPEHAHDKKLLSDRELLPPPDEKTLSEVRDAIERAYDNEGIREKFDIYLKHNKRPPEVPVKAWQEKHLFNEQYFSYPRGSSWCTHCRIRKWAHEKTTLCFLCIGTQHGSPNRRAKKSRGERCEYIFQSRGSAPPHLNPYPEIDLPGSQCREFSVNGKYCRLHVTCVHETAVFMESVERAKRSPSSAWYQATQARVIATEPWTKQQLIDRFPMSRFYTSLPDHLLDYIKSNVALEAKEIFDVREELLLARRAVQPSIDRFVQVQEYMTKYGPVLKEAIATLEEKQKTVTLSKEETEKLQDYRRKLSSVDFQMVAAQKGMMNSLSEVVTLADRASVIYNRHANVIDTNSLQRVVSHLLHLVAEKIGPEEIPALEQHIRSSINLPQAGMQAALVGPDDLIARMANTLGLPKGEMPNNLEIEEKRVLKEDGSLDQQIRTIRVTSPQ